MLSSVTPCASHTTLTMNQNWSRSSFPKPLNTRNFTVFAILNCGGGGGGVDEFGGDGGEDGGGVGEVGGDGSEDGGGVGRGGIQRNPYSIN